VIVKFIWSFAYYIIFRLIDKVSLEVLGSWGVYNFFVDRFAKGIVNLQSGFIFNYVFLMVL